MINPRGMQGVPKDIQGWLNKFRGTLKKSVQEIAYHLMMLGVDAPGTVEPSKHSEALTWLSEPCNQRRFNGLVMEIIQSKPGLTDQLRAYITECLPHTFQDGPEGNKITYVENLEVSPEYAQALLGHFFEGDDWLTAE